MRAYELMKETFFRRPYIWMLHVVSLALYVGFWWLLLPDPEEFGGFVFTWAGFILPLGLSAGILGDDIASGRICVLVTRPFWSGELYLYRLLGLCIQGIAHFALASALVWTLYWVTGRGSVSGLGRWFFASWLLFNVWAALSTTTSVLVKRALNALLLFVAALTLMVVASILADNLRNSAAEPIVTGLFRYPFPPFELLHDLGKGRYSDETVTLAGWQIAKGLACAIHSLVLTGVYAVAGIVLLSRRQFLAERQ
jgi:ABC-type transport system involved in multi-copper enzyme maturation permease subunit